MSRRRDSSSSSDDCDFVRRSLRRRKQVVSYREMQKAGASSSSSSDEEEDDNYGGTRRRGVTTRKRFRRKATDDTEWTPATEAKISSDLVTDEASSDTVEEWTDEQLRKTVSLPDVLLRCIIPDRLAITVHIDVADYLFDGHRRPTGILRGCRLIIVHSIVCISH